LTGDITAAGSLAVGAPNVLMEASFSRQMETEADTYALNRMQHLGIPSEHFANIMARMEFTVVREDKEKQSSLSSDLAVQDAATEDAGAPEESQPIASRVPAIH